MGNQKKLKSLLLFAGSLFLLCLNLGKPVIYILDEAKNAECAREMMVSGNYIVPYFNGQLRTDKPPLHYFFMIAGYKIFGVNAFGARFFSAVFGALSILLTFLFAKRFQSEKVGWLAVITLLASLHFNLQMRLSVPDPYLIFCMTGAFMSFYTFLSNGKKKYLYLMYACFGFGLLTKGPVALALPGLIMFVYLVLVRKFNWKNVRSLVSVSGIALMLIIAVPWYWLNYEATNGEWTEGFFLKHNLQRFSGSMEGHGGFFLLPLVMVIAGLLPLGIFSIPAILKGTKSNDKFIIFCLAIVLGIVLFFSFSKTKLPNYTTPVYPFLAILIGWFLAKIRQLLSPKWIKVLLVSYLIIAILLPAGVVIGLKFDKDYSNLSYLGWCFFLLPPGAIIAIYLYHRNRLQEAIYIISGTFIITNILFFTWAFPRAYKNNPVAMSMQILKNEKEIVYYKMMNPAYIFNMQRIIPIIRTKAKLKEYFQNHPDAVLISRKEYQTEIEANTSLKPDFEMRDTFENPVTIIFKSR